MYSIAEATIYNRNLALKRKYKDLFNQTLHWITKYVQFETLVHKTKNTGFARFPAEERRTYGRTVCLKGSGCSIFPRNFLSGAEQ